MTGVQIGLLMGVFMLAMLALRIHVGIAMFLAGAVGYVWISGWDALIATLKHAPYARFSMYDLSVVPLFLLMGQFATYGGLSRALFQAANAFIGHWRGGMAMAGVGACAGFGAICGSSLATAATMTQVVLPELRRHGYSPGLSGGAIAAGGTLGILIPPSVPLIIYAIIAEQNIAKMFMAALVPGVLAAVGYMIVVAVSVRLRADAAGPLVPRYAWSERWRTLLSTWPVIVIFAAVLGGIYSGLFTATEAAALGALATGVVAWKSGGLRDGGLAACIAGTASGTGMIFLILIGADMLSSLLAVSQISNVTAEWVQNLGLGPFGVLVAILVLYILLGCIMDSLSMIVITIPILLPVVLGLDYWGLGPDEKSIWFGVLAMVVMEMGLITPPVGMNVYVINGVARDLPLGTIFRGVVPFLVSDFIRLALLVGFPVLTLALVRWLG